MMIPRLFKILAILAVISLATGCKLAVVATSGGDVTSSSGTRDCAAGNVCEFEISVLNFNEIFTAIPKPGYECVQWRGAKNSLFLCDNQTSPTCTLSLVRNPAAAAIVAFNEYFGYLKPEFRDVGIDTDGDGVRDDLDDDDDNDGILDIGDPCPLTSAASCGVPIEGVDVVTVNGRAWAQVDLFVGLSWDDINAVCPGGVCVTGGVLNGYDVTGWKWASTQDVDALFDTFNPTNIPPYLSSGQYEYYGIYNSPNNPIATAFLSTSFRKWCIVPNVPPNIGSAMGCLNGWTSAPWVSGQCLSNPFNKYECNVVYIEVFGTYGTGFLPGSWVLKQTDVLHYWWWQQRSHKTVPPIVDTSLPLSMYGAWFYRGP